MLNRIIVLGGSYLQVSFIRTAESLGYHTLVVDGNPNCYCAQERVGDFYHLDFSNKALLKDFFRRMQAMGMFAPVNEFGNAIAAELAQELGYRYNSFEVVIISGDKKLFWRKLQGLQLAMAKSYQEEDLSKELLPVIIKPTISTSSKGVTLVVTENEVNDAVEYARRSGKSQEIRIEEYIAGTQYSLETLTVQGQHFLIGVIEEHLSDAPYFFERSDILNKQEQSQQREFFQDFVNTVLNALGIQVGPCHIEVKVFNGEIYLIDFASRSGGWRDMMLKMAGIDYNELIIEAYINNSSKGVKKAKASKSVGAAILNYHEDLLPLKAAQEKGFVEEIHFNGQVPKPIPKGLHDAYGYYFISAEHTSEFKGLLPTY